MKINRRKGPIWPMCYFFKLYNFSFFLIFFSQLSAPCGKADWVACIVAHDTDLSSRLSVFDVAWHSILPYKAQMSWNNVKIRFSQLCPLLQWDGLNALWHAVKAISDCLYQFHHWHVSHRVLYDSIHCGRGEGSSNWLHMHAKTLFSLLVHSHPHAQINNGVAGRRVSHCPCDLLFPAKRIKKGGRKGGEKGSLDEWMQTLRRRRWFATMLKEGRKEGWVDVCCRE